MDSRTRSGVHSYTLDLNISVRLPSDFTVFQTEIHAIQIAADRIWTMDLNSSIIRIDGSSQSTQFEYNEIHICAELIEIRVHDLTLVRVPGHNNMEGNEQATECALKASENMRTSETQCVTLSFV